MTEPLADIARFCAGCGYDLRAIPSDRCPECGTPFDPNVPTEPQIPWAHRDTLGRRRAFWRTVKLATFSTPTVAGEMHRPISFADARAFRRAVVWRAFWPTALSAAVGYVLAFGLHTQAWYPQDIFGSITLWAGVPVLLASLWLYLLLATGLPSYFFHPRHLSIRQQNRAVALSYYAAAPYAYLFILPIVSLGVALLAYLEIFDSRTPLLLMAVVYIAIAVPPGLLVLTIWVVPARMLKHTVQASSTRRFLLAFVAQPLGYLLCGLLTIGLMNLAYWAAVLLIHSFR